MQAYRPQYKYIIVLAVVSATVLIVGAKLRPKRPIQLPASPAEMLRLQNATQRRSLEDLPSFVANVASGVQPGVIWVAGLKQSALGWEPGGLVVTAGPDGPLPARISARGRRVEPEILSGHYPVAALRVDAEVAASPVFRSSAARLPKGSWILQVMVNQEGEYSYVPGSYGGTGSVECGQIELECLQTNLPLGPGTEGSGVFDIDRNLLGMVVRCRGRYAVITPAAVELVLRSARSFAGQLLRRYGLRVAPLTEQTSDYFGTDWGLLVTEVHRSRPAFVAGLSPGDIIQGLDDHEVRSADGLARLILPVAYPGFDVWVWRNRRTVKVTMPATDKEFTAADPLPSPGIVLRPSLDGFPIQEVVPGSPAAEAELRAGDRLIRIGNREPRNLAEAERVLAQRVEGPVYLTVQRDMRTFGVLVQ